MTDFDYSLIVVQESAGRAYVPKPTSIEIEQFEQHHQIFLPHSYCRFVKQFGAGSLAGLWSISSPMPTDHNYELSNYNQRYHGNPADRLLEGYGSPEFTDLFCFFADDGDHFYGWKTDEVTDQQQNEYPIYEFGYFDRLPRCADSFAALIARALTPAPDWTPTPLFTRFLL